MSNRTYKVSLVPLVQTHVVGLTVVCLDAYFQ
jgi:hypothetical protein